MRKERTRAAVTHQPRVHRRKKQSFFQQLEWPESFTSLVLGLLVVVVTGVIIVLAAKYHTKGVLPTATTNKQSTLSQSTKAPAPKSKVSTLKNQFPRTYTVVAGDSLWNIADKFYHSGYQWVALAQANNLTNPDVLYAGTKLTLPALQSPSNNTASNGNMTSGKATLSATEYTVQDGDCLWTIAQTKYNDPYKWVDIAKANNLATPDLLAIGEELTIPQD